MICRESENEKIFKFIFEESPISLWVEDFSAVKQYLNDLKDTGKDLYNLTSLEKKEISQTCLTKIRIIAINKAAVTLYEAENKDQLLRGLPRTFTDESYDTFLEEIIALSKGSLYFESEATTLSLRGARRNIIIRWSMAPEYVETWERIVVSIVDITLRKQAEDALQEKEAHLRLLLAQIPGAIYTTDANLRYTSMFSSTLQDVGLQPADFFGKPAGIFPPGHPDEDIVIDRYHRALAGETIHFIDQFRDLAYMSHLEPLRNAENAIIGVLGITFNVTEVQLAKQALEKKDAQLQLILSQMPGALYTTDVNLLYTSIFSTNLEGYDLPPSDFMGKSVNNFPSGYKDEGRVADFHYVALTGETVNFDESFHDQEYMFHLEPLRNPNKEIIGVLGTIIDITQRFRAEQALKKSEEELRLILNQMPGTLYTTDTNLRFTSMYSASLGNYGLKPEEYIGKTVGVFSSDHPDDLQIEEYHRRALFGNEVNYDARFRNKGYNVHIEPLRDSEGNIIGVLGLILDITERQRAEEDRMQISRERQAILEKTLKLSELKANIITQATHELKTPLTSIYGWASLLQNTEAGNKELLGKYEHEGLGSILHNARRMINLINDFLDMIHLESGRLSINRESVNFQTILGNAIQAVNFLAIQKKIEFREEISPGITLIVDILRIEQLFTNLLLNAVKYSPDRTCVTINAYKIDFPEGPKLRVLITDEGYGFTPEELAEAFTPFGKAYTQQPQKRGIQGTGLGLFISRGIVKQHGGTLTITSKGVNQGSTVEILLPLSS